MPTAKLRELGTFPTANAGKYIQQLCKHFAHKVEVTWDETSGTAALPSGPATLTATETELMVEITAADAEGLQRARYVIDSHMERFAFREAFKTMDWRKG
ncbi:DUF2218 domain-containing protein [Algicella marina]|uniref:DUF2218 domain-containing protein n=1 Tax=Algicella marina TaxID=2683284 RepID=A0A6P1T3P4_9RHOB|nr:DUF2218 domain-containing protein [Algicella marina]QHQ35142.1 DUF2218 domain-containing protein [Algicella marina]